MDLTDAWIKAAVEHVTLQTSYHSARTKDQITIREVEPDFIGTSRDGKNSGCWGYCKLRRANRVFKVDSILGWDCIGTPFQPNPQGRWRELIPRYKRKRLDRLRWRGYRLTSSQVVSVFKPL